jgi:hypothetical protein
VSLSGALCAAAAGLAILLVPASSARAQGESDPEWKVLTVARNGAWGLSTARFQGDAIAGAVRQCESRSIDHSDCGAELVAYRIGWAVAILCGDHRVLVSAGDLDEVETAAAERLAMLELFNPSGLPACRRLLTVNPVGGITTERARKGDRLPPDG